MADWDRRRDERDRYDRGRDEGREWHRPQPGGGSRDQREFARGDEGFQRGYRRHGGSFEAGAGGDFGAQGQRNRGWDEDRGHSFGRDPYGGDRGRGDWERGRAGFRDDLGREGGRDFGTDWAEEGYGQGFVGNEGRGYGPGRDYENERRVTSGSGGRGERGWWDRASDEVASWFGDEDAERRRQQDHRGRGPRGYTRSDERIKEDVSDRLADDPWVDASEIDVTVNASEVTLSGSIDSREARRRAEDIVERVSGVSYVQNNLRVQRPQPPTGRTTADRPSSVAASMAAATGTLPASTVAGTVSGNGSSTARQQEQGRTT
jgi:osmotically-inducible protein OsmY